MKLSWRLMAGNGDGYDYDKLQIIGICQRGLCMSPWARIIRNGREKLSME